MNRKAANMGGTAMRKIGILALVGVLALVFAGCGGGYSSPPIVTGTITVQILSDLASDGDIAFDPVLSSYLVTKGPSTVLFGIDSLNSHLPEYRAFLTFPLDGITGQPVVPSDAFIVSADVEVFVNFLDFASAVPTFLDLVQYPFRGLGSGNPAIDFNAVPLAILPVFDFFTSDVRKFVRIEVTSLMQAAQVPPALVDFQLRFSSDITGPGLVGLDDTSSTTAPLLTVTYTVPATSVPPLAPSAPSRPSAGVGRTVVPAPRAMDGVVPRRQPETAKPLSSADLAARRR
jgi:hypothetical protein